MGSHCFGLLSITIVFVFVICVAETKTFVLLSKKTLCVNGKLMNICVCVLVRPAAWLICQPCGLRCTVLLDCVQGQRGRQAARIPLTLRGQ